MEGDPPPEPITQSLTTPSTTSPILFDTLVLLILRVVYYFLARRFLHYTVNPAIRGISQPESLLPPTNASSSSTTFNETRENSSTNNGIIPMSDIDFDVDTEDDAVFTGGAGTPMSSYPPSPTPNPHKTPARDGFPRRGTEDYFGPYPPSTSSLPLMPSQGDSTIELQQLGQKLKDAGAGVTKKIQVLQLSHGKSSTSAAGTKGTKRATRGLHRISRGLFSICFAESCNLLSLVIFHALGILHTRSRRVNFSISLHVLLAIILLVVPLVQCLLLTYRARDSSSSASTTPSRSSSLSLTSRLLISLIPFTLYIFLFTRIPPYITAIPINAPSPEPTPSLDVDNPSATTIDEAIVQWSTSGPEGWEQGGWLAPSLGRVVVLGIVALGCLSGFGAVRSAWNFTEHIIGSGSQSISDNDILQAERSLYRVRHDLVSKREELNRVSASSGIVSPARGGWMGRVFGGQADQEAAALHAELKGLEAMESQVSKSLKAMKLRKKRQKFGQTFRGRLYNILGYVFAAYCAARLLMCLPSLFFAPLSTSQAGDEQQERGKGNTNGDWISFLLALAISHLPTDSIDIDVAVWSRGISLILTGLLILSSLAQVMRSLSRILRLTSKTVGAGFLLLSLGQLFSTYVISLLVQLRTSLPPAPLVDNDPFALYSNGTSIDTSQTDNSLLLTLPDFRVFGRLFDIMFLLAALSTAVYRYIAMKVAGADDSGEIYRH